LNFLSHFYIDEQPHKSAAYHLGLILPDISRGLVKGLGRHPTLIIENEFFMDLNEGCRKHLAADKRFHASPFFEHGSAQCLEMIKQLPFQEIIHRKWFIGHILFEMLLDRLLVQHITIVAPRFYNYMRQIEENKLADFMNHHNCSDTVRFLRNFEHFRKVGYIANYPDNNLFAYSLSRVLMRAGLPPLSFADKQILMEGVQQLESRFFANRQALLYELKNVFE
jgi:hypothetical protein